jgi:hypothetical protein
LLKRITQHHKRHGSVFDKFRQVIFFDKKSNREKHEHKDGEHGNHGVCHPCRSGRQFSSTLVALVQTLEALLSQVIRDYDRTRQALRSDPIPPGILAEANSSIDEAEILDTIREIASGGGRTLDDFLPELKKAACHQSV